MNSFRNVMDYIGSRTSLNLWRVGLLLPAIFISSASFAAEPVCAVVKIEIQQELTLERQAFDAVMRINNGLDLLSLENVNINVTFKDETGAAVEATSDTTSTTAKFFIKVDSMSGITDISGFGSVAPKTTAEVHWLIIPAPGAGGETPSGKLYFVGASLEYNLGGELQTTVVTPDSIYVKPLPLLSLDYFLEKDVFADDAFTPEVEPAIPFTLGVRVKNNGAASATGLKIDSAQPTITENKQGLLIGFNIIGSNIDEAPSTNSLLIDFGEIKPNESTMGRWDMVTTLSGRFTEFTADFSHADDLGGRLTSIIDPAGINTHLLVRNVRVDVAGRDFVRDFLAFDDPVYRVYESSGVDTDVTDVSDSSTLTPVSTGTEVSLNFTMPVTADFSYAKKKDPYAGTKVVKQMVRSDGKAIPLDNVWTSKTRLVDGNTVGWEYWINVFDANTTGSYALLMGAPDLGPVAPEFTPLNNITTYETATVSFPVSATDANGDAVTLTAGTLPTDATFTSDTSGSGTFTWTPPVGQAGNHTITFTASDGTLTKQTSVNIKVNPAGDTDGDGMDDAWEILMFGDLSRDGTGDLDGDGVTDLQEFLNQTDPNLDPPLVPTNLVALPGNAENTLSWDTVTGVDSYNVYWSLTADVSPTNGSLENASSSPYVHAGLDNDVTYYYVVTSVGLGGESAASNIVSVTTGLRDWTSPTVFTNDVGTSSQNVRIAMTNNGDAIAVWQQTNINLNTIMASNYVVGSGWSVPVALSSPTLNASNVQIAMDNFGNGLAVWQEGLDTHSDIVSARYDVTVGWEAMQLVETDSVNAATNPQLAIGLSGSTVVVWQQGSSIHSNIYVNGAWQADTLIATENDVTVSNLSLSLNNEGNGFAVWTSSSDQNLFELRSSQLNNNNWIAPLSLASNLDNASSPAIAVNDFDHAILVWTEFDGTRHTLMTSQYEPTSGWSVMQDIGNLVGDAKTPQVVMSEAADAYVTWTQSSSPYSVYVKRFDGTTVNWEAATGIEQRERGDASNPQINIDLSGNAVVTWQQHDGVQQNIIAALYNHTVREWDIERVIETSNRGDAVSPVIAMNSSGNAVVAWQQNNDGVSSISTNHYEAGNSGVPNIAPIAVTGNEQSEIEGVIVTLDGSASFDQDGSGLITSYSWTQTVGLDVGLSGFDTATPTFQAPTVLATDGPQVFEFELTVTDDANATSTNKVIVTVNAVNDAPVANAGTEINADEQTTVTLSGSGSDADGTVDTYSWTQISGTTVTLTNATTATATFDAPVVTIQEGVQTFVFELTVTDNEGATATSQVNVLVSPVNATPVANAGIAFSANEQTSVSLSGSGSDSDGVVVSYAWSQVSGLAVTFADATFADTTFTAPIVLVQDGPQTLVLRLTVTDNEGATFSDDISITINAVNTPPTVSAGLGQTVDEQTTVPFSVTTADLDGSIVSYQWNQTSGKAATITNPNSIAASFTAPVVLTTEGLQTVSFTLTVTDNEGAVVTSAPVTFTISPVNADPVADAGTDKAANEETLVSLTGSGSDTDGTIATYSWSQVSGLPVTLTGAATANVSFTAPTVLVQDGPQTIVLALTVSDNEGASVSDEVSIVINAVNLDPTVNAGTNKTVDEQSTVTLTGAASDADVGGSITSYEWTQISGSTVTLTSTDTATTSFTAPEVLVQDGAQTLTFRLTVTDNETATVFDDINIVVNPVNADPVANAGVDKLADEETLVSLTGSGSDTDGTITSYSWSQVTGLPVTLIAASTENVSFTAPTVLVQDGPQSIVLALTVIDNEGASVSDEVSIVVNAVNLDPTVNAGTDQTVNEESAVSLTGTASDADIGGSITSYAWTQTGGTAVTLTNANTATASFTAPTVLVQEGAQTLTFRLTVTDNETATVFDDVSVVVNPVNADPVVNTGTDKIVDEQTSVSLIATASDSDVGGSITSYEWTQISGVNVTLTGANTPNATFTAPEVLVQDGAQTLTFRLTVTDNETATAFDEINVVVNPVNVDPVANAGVDKPADEETLVALTGAGSDTDGSIASYSWSQISGLPVSLTGAATENVSFTAPTVLVQDGPKTIVLALTVTDNEGASATDDVSIVINAVNLNPTVNAGADKSVNEQTAVTLSGTASDADVGGSITSYTWTQILLPGQTAVTLTNANSATASFAAPTVLVQDGAQTLTFRLTVVDNETATVFDDINVVVNPVNADPIANAGVDKSADEESLVSLTGSGSDTDGTIATYSWSQVSGLPVTLAGASTENISFTAPTVLVQDGPQTIVLALTVTDNEGSSVSDEVSVVVNAVNLVPVVNAGTDKTVDEQTALTLSGTGTDTDGSINAYQWTQTAGEIVTLTNANTANVSFTTPIVLVQDGARTLTFRLTVTDNETSAVFDDVNVVVNPVNAVPVANAGADQNIDEQTAVILSGTGTDTDGSITAYEWTQTSGVTVTLTNANTANASFTAPVVLVQDGAQTLTFRLTVTDNETATVFDDISVVVNPVNAIPTASAGVDQSVNEQAGVTLTAAANDSDGSIASYVWSQVNGLPVTLTNANADVATFTSPVVLVQDGPQNLTFRVTATDNEGAVVTDDIVITVNAVNASPVSNAGLDQNVNEQTAVTLAGSASDTDGSITSYQWSQTNGATVTLTNANTANASFTTPVVLVQDGAQTLTFRLTVIDNETATVFDDINVVVNPVNASPVSNAGIDQTVNEQTAVTLAGSATDSDGSITSYKWTQTAGTTVTLANASTATATFTSPTVLVQDGAQTLRFRLTVIDNETATVFDDINIVVNPVNATPTANAGIDQSVNEQTAVTLTGIASDSDGSITAYEWTQTNGVNVTLTGANTINATFTSPVVLVQDGAQTLTFRLTVTDNETSTVFDDINVVVNPVNVTPTASAGANRAVNEQTPVTLSGSGADTDGSITTYQWLQITGPTVTLANANTATPNFTTPVVLVADSPTVLTFRLTVTDNETAIATSDVNIGVMAVNASPVTNAGVDQVVNEQTGVTLSAAANDSDGNIVTYQWTQVSGLSVTLATANAATATFTSPTVLVQDGAQVLTFRSTVTDNEGGIHADEITVTVNPVNALPVANAGMDQYVDEYTTVTLSGLATDIDGSITAYQWTQVAGLPVAISNSTSAIASFVAPPVYQDEVLSFNLVVTDNETGVSAADTVAITLHSVNPDDDADGLPDLYEIANFGDLNRDGSADLDNDGYSDLQEYQDGTNPLALTLAAPTGLKAVAANTQVKLKWGAVTDAVGYNVYWDTVPNVTKDSNVINNVTSGYVHTGLTNGMPYYYVVTSLSSGDESVVSNEVSATPGKRTWQKPSIVDSATTTYFYPQIAMNRTGQSVVVYEHFDGVAYSAWATMYDKETGWSTPLAIETGDAGHVYNPQVAIDDNGNAVAVWEQYNGSSYNVWANVYDAQSRSWSIAEQIETSLTGGAEYFMPQVAMSQSGSAVVTWQKRDGLAISIWASRYDMGTGWTQAERLETNDSYSAYLPKVDVDSAGNAAVVWEQIDSTTGNKNIWSAIFNTVTGWSASSIISNLDNQIAYDAQVAVSDSGRAVAVWEQFDGTRFNVWTNVAQNGVWSTAERVEYSTTGTNEYFMPHVAMDKTGNATVVWQKYDGNHISAWTNRYVNGTWEVAQRVEVNDITPITNPKVAMDEEGNAVVVWEQYDDSSKNSLISVWANRYGVSTGWGSAQPLETNDTETMWFPEVSMDAYGNAQAVWFHNGLTEDNILVAENILQTNPPTANAGLDQGGIAGRDTVTLDASASSDTEGTIVSYQWHQLSGEEVTIDNKNTVAPSFSAPRVSSVLTFIVTVTDNDGLTSSDTVVITVGDVSVTGLFLNLLGNSGKVAIHGLASGVMPEQWALRHDAKTLRKSGKTKFSGRFESFSNDRDSRGASGRVKPIKNIK